MLLPCSSRKGGREARLRSGSGRRSGDAPCLLRTHFWRSQSSPKRSAAARFEADPTVTTISPRAIGCIFMAQVPKFESNLWP